MSEETTYVVVSRRKAGDSGYKNATYCNTLDEANVILDEVSLTAGDHSVMTRDEFSAEQEKADDGDTTTKNDEV